MGHVGEVAGVLGELVHDDAAGHGGKGIGGEVVGLLPAAAVVEVPGGIVEDGRLCVALAGLVDENGLGGGQAGGGEVLDDALRAVPRGHGDEGVVLADGEVVQAGGVGGHVVLLLLDA